jgi:hypothetical protein
VDNDARESNRERRLGDSAAIIFNYSWRQTLEIVKIVAVIEQS